LLAKNNRGLGFIWGYVQGVRRSPTSDSVCSAAIRAYKVQSVTVAAYEPNACGKRACAVDVGSSARARARRARSTEGMMQWGETKDLACACDAAVGAEASRRREATGRHRERMRARVEEMVGEGDTRRMEPGLHVRRHAT
jgi:hypothetical protein